MLFMNGILVETEYAIHKCRYYVFYFPLPEPSLEGLRPFLQLTLTGR